ncbi:DNA helicase [Tanacetum coccineum]
MECDGNGTRKKQCSLALHSLSTSNTIHGKFDSQETPPVAMDSVFVHNPNSVDSSMECDGNGTRKNQCSADLYALSINNTTDGKFNSQKTSPVAMDIAFTHNHNSEVLAASILQRDEEENKVNTNTKHMGFRTNTVPNEDDVLAMEQCKRQRTKRSHQLTDSSNCRNRHLPTPKKRRILNNNHYGKRPLSKGKDEDHSIDPHAHTTGKWRVRNWRKLYVDPIRMQYLNAEPVSTSMRIPLEYSHLGKCTCVCRHCEAMFWESEKVISASRANDCAYNKCCYGGRISLRPSPDMTSLGANVDNSVNNGKGPYVFRISGQIYHWIGAMYPDEGNRPRFLQLYIHDTTNEVNNRMAHFQKEGDTGPNKEIVEGLIEFLDNHNALVQLFRTARDKYMDANIPKFKVRLYNVTRQYELPTTETIGAIVFAESSEPENVFDLIIEEHSHFPQRVNKLHPCYMSLQFPLLFVYGEDGYQADMKLANVAGQSTKANKRMTMNMYYSYQMHERLNHNSLLLQGGGPRYMYAHYLNALAICRVHGSPSFFITFTCNAKWPKIKEYMEPFPQLKTADRTDIVDRIFEKKVSYYINFVRDSTTFGDVTAVLYTIEFQKRGLPHCHSLLWVNNASKAQEDSDIDKYICAELPDPMIDIDAHNVISELMIHGPCGAANLTATCMKDGGTCNRNFPKAYCNRTYIDKDDFIHYRRLDTVIEIKRQNVWLDNRYVVPYNRTLCMRYYAYINVEYFGWTMLIKYLFKYISKGTDRVIANVTRPAADIHSTSTASRIAIDEIKNYIEARYIGPHEACWRILDFPIHYRNPPIQTLAVHLENMQQITF